MASALELIAHGGHPVYDHPAMAAIAITAIIVPLLVLAFIGRVFVRSAREERERERGAP